ncbi:alpha-amylase family glycosyl hydrolase [Aquirufa sp.]|uniref:alpha-amylase family glycosyl hydrolase n=1 Tax=Aquirufa sp. TaxID=2676249 RepID=UPI0037C05FEA
MYNPALQKKLHELIKTHKIKDSAFQERFTANLDDIYTHFHAIYGSHPSAAGLFESLLNSVCQAHLDRSDALKKRDTDKEKKGTWFLSQDLVGMSLYVDRFAGQINKLPSKLPYLEKLGVNFLHLMPLFKSPEGESDGGYAVEDFRVVEERLGTIDDLRAFQAELQAKDMYLMIDIVLNHTSHHHEWAKLAKKGIKEYQDYFYMYDDRRIPDLMDETMPEIFPESSPGSFTYDEKSDKWVMTVFHQYQWDLNYTNPRVFVEMLGNVFFYANLGVDVVRIDAPAFIWKQVGTTCQNLPEAHQLLQLIKMCVEVATPGMAILGEAIVAPAQIMEYFGTGRYATHECDFAYNATQMAVQWDALATGDVRIMQHAQHELQRKPLGTTWLTYTRCHDDIGLGYDDYMIEHAGFTPYDHRMYIKNYYSGTFPGTPARGALFAINPKTQDARLSGSLASLCGLESAIEAKDAALIQTSIDKIILMQAMCMLVGGVPMLFYGDEAGYTNDYSYLEDPGKSYDNRWMHRPVIDWKRAELVDKKGMTENKVYSALQKLIKLRRSTPILADLKNIQWLGNQNNSIAGFIRFMGESKITCLFNFSSTPQSISWFIMDTNGKRPEQVQDLWSQETLPVGMDHEHLELAPYQFRILR